MLDVQNINPSCREFGELREEGESQRRALGMGPVLGMCGGRESRSIGMGKEGEDGPGEELWLGNKKSREG